MSINGDDIEKVAAAAAEIPPAKGMYLENDYIMNLLATVIDYQMHTKAVQRSLAHFRDVRWDDVRTLDQLLAVLVRYGDDRAGNTALAQYLWGNNHWRRASELRGLVRYFVDREVTDQEALRDWAQTSSFKTDFEGHVRGLGLAIYNWLVMRQGVDTVKPDVHVRGFTEKALARRVNDDDVVAVVTAAAHKLGMRAYELDWAIWEHSSGN